VSRVSVGGFGWASWEGGLAQYWIEGLLKLLLCGWAGLQWSGSGDVWLEADFYDRAWQLAAEEGETGSCVVVVIRLVYAEDAGVSGALSR